MAGGDAWLVGMHGWWGCVAGRDAWLVVQPPWKMVWRFLTKLDIVLPYVSAAPLLGIHTNELKIYPYKNLLIISTS